MLRIRLRVTLAEGPAGCTTGDSTERQTQTHGAGSGRNAQSHGGGGWEARHVCAWNRLGTPAPQTPKAQLQVLCGHAPALRWKPPPAYDCSVGEGCGRAHKPPHAWGQGLPPAVLRRAAGPVAAGTPTYQVPSISPSHSCLKGTLKTGKASNFPHSASRSSPHSLQEGGQLWNQDTKNHCPEAQSPGLTLRVGIGPASGPARGRDWEPGQVCFQHTQGPVGHQSGPRPPTRWARPTSMDPRQRFWLSAQ